VQHPSRNQNAQAPAQIQTQAAPPPDVTVTSPGTGGPQEKKVRSLLKKIRAIEDLKMRQASGEKLEDTQVKKIATEESIRKELESLGFNA
jgi:translation initiation factor 2A